MNQVNHGSRDGYSQTVMSEDEVGLLMQQLPKDDG